MAKQSFQLDPNAQSYTDNEIVGKVNAASTDITRAGSVDPAARPIEALEITNSHIATAAGIAKSKLAALNIVNADVDAGAAIVGTKLASTAAKDNLDALSDTARGYIKTDPASGQFKVISIERQADGKAKVDYDDVPV